MFFRIKNELLTTMLSVRTFEGNRIVLEPGETADVTRITPGMEDLKVKGKLSFIEISNSAYDDGSGHEYSETYPTPLPNDSCSSGEGVLSKYDKVMLTAQHIQDRRIRLSARVTSPKSVIFLPEGGIPQFPDIDFKTENNTLYWDNLGLDGFLEKDEVIHIHYS